MFVVMGDNGSGKVRFEHSIGNRHDQLLSPMRIFTNVATMMKGFSYPHLTRMHRPSLFLQILFHHPSTDRMIEVLVLLKGLER